MLKKEEVLKEELVLNDNLSLIKSKLDELKIDINSKQSELNVFRDYVWNDCKALRTSDDLNSRLEFDFLLEQQLKKEYIYNEKNILKRKLIKSYNSPYFGKIIFNNKDYYIGSAQINDDTDIRIYDWRAPISSIFYDYGLGSASYKFKDTIYRGNVTQKRQFVIENTKLKSVIENEQNIDDELLQDILSKESSDKMNSIINTIQSEQNQVIRNLSDNVLITEGVAGSGKTEIALHRIAYLLYHKEEFSNNNVLILSPNDVFTKYISNVLPELSEDNVLSTTYNSFARTYLKLECENYSDFLDRVYNKKMDIDEFKEEYIDKVKEFVGNYADSIRFKNSISINNIKFTKDELNNILVMYKKYIFMERINLITEYIIDKTKLKREYYDKIRDSLVTMLDKSIDVVAVYNEYLKINNKELISDYINYEHITPMLNIVFYINDYPENLNIKHIVIDEAQDYSFSQIELLKNIFPACSFTILGDINQNLNPYVNYNSLEDYLKIFNGGSYYKLSKAYRSTKNIMDYASKILNINIDSFRSEGSKVEVKTRDSLVEDVKKLSNKRLGIITYTKSECEEVYNKLKDVIEVNSPLINGKTNGVVILPLYIAKGLEFDGVIIYDSFKLSDKQLYVGVTRAQNNLIIYK
jgi:DNA helicase-2/ATP-dependent DNA helicase PcrA